MSFGPVNWSNFRVNFFKDGFEKLIEVHGTRFDWEAGTWCPNFINNDEDQHSIDCSTCGDANGILYYGDVKKVKIIKQSLKIEHVYRAEGRFDLGTVLLTPPSDVDLHIWDKLTIIDSTERHPELVTRNSVNLTDRTRYFIHGVNTLQTPEKEFILNQDFTIVNGKVVWASDAVAPVDKDIYTIDYITHPIYIVVEIPKEIRDHITRDQPLSIGHDVFQHLPKLMMAKRDFLLRDESKDTRT